MTREEAIKWLNKLYVRADITDEYGDMEDMQPYEEAIDIAVKALEQEPKTGHWIDKGSLSCRCDQCGCKNIKESPYCPWCGAYMKEVEK